MIRQLYTDSAGKVGKLFISLLLVSGLVLVNGQVYHGCPVHDHGLHDYQNPLYEKWLSAYDVKSCRLQLTVSNVNTRIDGSAGLLVEAVRDLDTLVLELQDALTVHEVLFSDTIGNQFYPEDNILGFKHENDAVYIVLDRTMTAGELFQVLISYEGDAGQNRGFFAGITSERDYDYGFDVTYTLSEPENARDWFPVKQVLEDKIDSVTFSIRCNRELLAASNGILADIEEKGNDHILTWRTHYPMAYYLLSFAVADYRDFSFQAALSGEGDSMLVQNFIYNGDQVFADLEDQIRMTGPLITTFSRLLVDYPFSGEKYGHAMAPMGGGMEHQTMTTLQDFNFYLVAHELAHQWFGDFVTCGNWQDIWINEGFASYFEYVAAQELLGQDAADAWMDQAMSIALRETTGSVYVPEDRVKDTYRLFDYGLSYKKGATLLHMIRFILEDDALFFSTMKTYLAEYGKGLATGADFQGILESVSGRDFSCFFDQWYYGEGFPRFKLYWEQKGDSLIIQSEQSGSNSSVTPLFQVPFEIEVRMVGGIHQRIRLMQNTVLEDYAVPVQGLVEDLIFDPDNSLLETSQVIHQLPSGTAFRYGPNPVTGELFIQFPDAGPIGEVRITNMSGQQVMKQTGMGNPALVDLSTLADGPYLLELSNNQGTYLGRIVKISEE
jgi:aminopeptidase N